MRQFFAFVVGVLKNPDPSRTLTILVLLIIGASIPLTVYVGQQQQDVKQRASDEQFACGRPDQTRIGSAFGTCDDGQGNTCTRYNRYINTTEENGDGIADPNDQDDQPWCDGHGGCDQPCQPTPTPAPTTTPVSTPVPTSTSQDPFACYENRGRTVGPNDKYEQCGGDAHLTCPDGVPDGRYQPTDLVGVIRYHCSDGTYYLTSPIPSKNYLCQPTSTTTPPGVTVVLTPIPPGPAPCATPHPKNQGNANDDCSINIADYNIWRSEFLGTTNTKRADFDGNNVVDLIDFNIWRNNIYNLVQP